MLKKMQTRSDGIELVLGDPHDVRPEPNCHARPTWPHCGPARALRRSLDQLTLRARDFANAGLPVKTRTHFISNNLRIL